ncbi:hypothetical protein P378_19910 [Desulforamulus profundi]|uniref:Uncharacterized protein n=1 Tax=Desulforamulus profundi TaxID=1383067 RepID=A0A2C6MC62_9FIRM|nr:hypothetical protein [Desulforamulus profundi]PHJ36863.1 hypothetical protein P378_19910 [Desulforamulus profundi]
MVEKICKTCGSPFYPSIDGGSEKCDYCLTHCEHGTYIGYPGGPDYLCCWCEAGISVEKMEKMLKVHQIFENRWTKHRVKQLIKIFQKEGAMNFLHNQQFLNTLVETAKADVRRFGEKALIVKKIRKG